MSAYEDELALPHVMCCRDCHNVWDVEYTDDGDGIARDTDRICPQCSAEGGDVVVQLRVEQARHLRCEL